MIRALFAPLTIALLIIAMGGGALRVNAQEQTNWFFGVGLGGGLSQLDRKYSDSSRNRIGLDWSQWNITPSDNTIKDWGFAWEVLAGYKHWLNNWVGFRYYVNASGQHYKDDIFTAGKSQVGVIQYTANADLLLNFYNSEIFTLGIFGGFGVGGAYFDSPALNTYKQIWSQENPMFSNERYKGMGNVYKHHLAAILSAGARFNFFQKVRAINGKRVCNRGAMGRTACRAPIAYLEHSIEFAAKISMMTYRVTDHADMVGVYATNTANPNPGGYRGYISVDARPGYEVKNPYQFTLRYLIAF